MPRKSSIARLPDEVKNELVQEIESGRRTMDELVDWLSEAHGYVISRSAMGRFAQRLSRRSRAIKLMAETTAEDGDAGNDEAVELMMQLAQLRLREARIVERLRELGVG
ncbi:phage protein Gp27 family protein [Arhodomonas sp. AD133]|uniref:phage protein Gp27 family protein n=1 Tax=Arhodomonas sp. AD133 TaxID=3415009 RepID=UPI003EB8E26C